MFRGRKKSALSPEDVAGHFRKKITKKEERWIRSCFDHFLFIDDREGRRRGVCSVCGKPVEMKVPTTHNEWGKCPKCGEFVHVKHTWRGVKQCTQERVAYIYEKSRKDANAIGCRTIVAGLCMEVGDNPDAASCARLHLWEDSLTLFRYGYGALQVENWGDAWGYAASLTERGQRGRIPTWWRCVKTSSIREAVKGTPFAWSEWEKFSRSSYTFCGTSDTLIRFFDFFAKYEAAEYLLKTGLHRLVQQYLWGYCTGRAINWHGMTPNEIFRMRTTKADRKYLLAHPDNVGLDDIRRWRDINRMMSHLPAGSRSGGARYSIEMAARILAGVNALPRTVFRYIPVEKAIRYLEGQGPRPISMLFRDYNDYLRECVMLGLDMQDRSTLYPRNLIRAHENLSGQVRHKKDELLEERWRERREQVEKRYAFSCMGMHVQVPEHIFDLVQEGVAQKNCVGGYMERVARGETDVVFIRRDAAPEESYITMEIQAGRIVQARAKCNGAPDEKGMAFVDAFWKARLKKGEKSA